MVQFRKFLGAVSETWEETPKTLQAVTIILCVVLPTISLVAKLIANDQFWESLM